VTANLTAFNTTIRDFQAQVVNADVGVLRGYLANAEEVRVRGVELDGSARVGRRAALALVNARVGFRWADGWSVFVWSRNLFDQDYFELLTAPGNTGLFVGQPGDGRTIGLTLRMALRAR
jgi:outer membrane receptor protein involved in Fe transport